MAGEKLDIASLSNLGRNCSPNQLSWSIVAYIGGSPREEEEEVLFTLAMIKMDVIGQTIPALQQQKKMTVKKGRNLRRCCCTNLSQLGNFFVRLLRCLKLSLFFVVAPLA